MTSVYNYINAAFRHGLNRDHALFMEMVREGCKEGSIFPRDAESLFKAFRRGRDHMSPPSYAVLHHPLYGSLTKKQWERQVAFLSAYIKSARSYSGE